MLTDTSQTRIAGSLLALQNAGWDVTFPEQTTITPPAVVAERYPNAPADYLLFLGMCGKCDNPAETAWLFTNDDFADSDTVEFAWNFCENLSLSNLEDGEAGDAIRAFWNRHLPIGFAALSDYAYLAIVTEGEHAESVVYGTGPDFEKNTTVIAESFTEFLGMLARRANVQPEETAEESDVSRAFGDFCQG